MFAGLLDGGFVAGAGGGDAMDVAGEGHAGGGRGDELGVVARREVEGFGGDTDGGGGAQEFVIGEGGVGDGILALRGERGFLPSASARTTASFALPSTGCAWTATTSAGGSPGEPPTTERDAPGFTRIRMILDRKAIEPDSLEFR